MFAVLILACSLAAGLIGAQQFDPRERFEAPHSAVRVNREIMRAHMKNNVSPNCSDAARRRKLQGEVVLFVAVNEKGRVSNLRVIAGEPVLAELGVEAADRLRFRPYYLNGEAVPFEGPIKYGLQCR